MTNRLPRLFLLAWTVALALGISWTIPSLPSALGWTLLPYLALVAWSLISSISRNSLEPVTENLNSEQILPQPPIEPEIELRDSSPILTEPESDPGPTPIPDRTGPSRPRRKTRSRIFVEPAPAAWVQVGPGRFVRESLPEPQAQPVSESEESEPANPLTSGSNSDCDLSIRAESPTE